MRYREGRTLRGAGRVIRVNSHSSDSLTDVDRRTFSCDSKDSSVGVTGAGVVSEVVLHCTLTN